MRSERDGAALQTPRLLLRAWRDEDLDELATLCADPAAMRYFPALLGREQSQALLIRLQQHFADHGFTFWSLWHREDGRFVGMTGLAHVGFEARFTPAVEIGWRLSPAFWGQGLAQEAARASLDFAFTRLAVDRVVAFTTLSNAPSQRVMRPWHAAGWRVRASVAGARACAAPARAVRNARKQMAEAGLRLSSVAPRRDS